MKMFSFTLCKASLVKKKFWYFLLSRDRLVRQVKLELLGQAGKRRVTWQFIFVNDKRPVVGSFRRSNLNFWSLCVSLCRMFCLLWPIKLSYFYSVTYTCLYAFRLRVKLTLKFKSSFTRIVNRHGCINLLAREDYTGKDGYFKRFLIIWRSWVFSFGEKVFPSTT